jgi:hypothetical protein
VYLDKGGHRRDSARRRWWDESARTLRDIAEIPVGTEDQEGGLFAPLPETPVLDASEYAYAGDVPVIVGHYWKSGTPAVLGPKAACVDRPAAQDVVVDVQSTDGIEPRAMPGEPCDTPGSY